MKETTASHFRGIFGLFWILLLIFALIFIFTTHLHGQGGGQGGTIPSIGGVQQSINCGTTVACAGTAQAGVKVVFGSAPLTTGTPSTATLTGLPFTSLSTYFCAATEATNQANNTLKFANASGASTVITGAATNTDTINYICVGT